MNRKSGFESSHGPGTRTRSLMKHIKLGISGYEAEYQKWPVPESQRDYFAILRGSVAKCLLGEKSEMNPKAIQLIEAERADLPPSRNPRPGVMYDNLGEPWFLDEWGRPIYIGIDTNGDGKLAMPDGARDAPKYLPFGVALFSTGPDGIPGNADDVTSWR